MVRRIVTGVVLTLVLTAAALPSRGAPINDGAQWGSLEGYKCHQCHQDETPGLVEQWRLGRMGQSGVNCYDCHRAEKGEPDAVEHEGAWISLLVSPEDCARCHRAEVEQQQRSHHARGGDILDSADNFLGEVVGGPAAVAVGCRQCHGSKIEVLPDGSLSPDTWPNTGIGRINPDGSLGSCSACHTRHRFSRAQARHPRACGKCHLGPDHPQIEVYEESKHGILFAAFSDELNMDRKQWIAGQDYFDAPTCATCHMGATPDTPTTHDVGTRLSWNLRSVVSTKMKDWKNKRSAMEEVCAQCHTDAFVSGFYTQLDEFVVLYNEKFAIPARDIRQELIDNGKLTPTNFDDEVDWIFWELWHHEGRRARHGASMSGPDYAWWQGMYEVAKHFYVKYLPAVREAAGDELYEDILERYIRSREEHRWFTEGMTRESLDRIQKYYRERYGKDQ